MSPNLVKELKKDTDSLNKKSYDLWNHICCGLGKTLSPVNCLFFTIFFVLLIIQAGIQSVQAYLKEFAIAVPSPWMKQALC